MIAVTDLHGKQLYLNADLIEYVESTPDTQIVLTTGRHIYAAETPAEVARKVVEFKRQCLQSGGISGGASEKPE